MDIALHEQHSAILMQGGRYGHNLEDDPDELYSWVMLTQNGDIEPLPNETAVYKTKGRIALQLSAPSPGQGIPAYSRKSTSGTAYITSQRAIYLPSTKTPELGSFSVKILNCEDAHPGAPLFGASYWEASFRPVPNGNIPADYPRITLRLTFNDGGYSDWSAKFNDMKERIAHVAQIARETGHTEILNTVTGEQLPAYSAGDVGSNAQTEASQVQVEQQAEEAARQRQETQAMPDEPPPDYDEAQAQAVAERFDERTLEDAERR